MLFLSFCCYLNTNHVYFVIRSVSLSVDSFHVYLVCLFLIINYNYYVFESMALYFYCGQRSPLLNNSLPYVNLSYYCPIFPSLPPAIYICFTLYTYPSHCIYMPYYCPIFPSLPSLNSRISCILPYEDHRSLLNEKTGFFLTFIQLA